MGKTHRYLLVWDRMGDYHVARWRALQNLVGAENAFAADLSAGDALYGWQTAWAEDPQYRRLSSKSIGERDVDARLTAFKALVSEQNISYVALSGYGLPEYRQMAIHARLRGCHVTLFAESWYPSAAKWKDSLKGFYISALAQTFLVSGLRAENHFCQNLGIAKKRIATGYSVVDNAHFAQAKGQVTKEKTVLCVARFAPEKNLTRLVEAFAFSPLPAADYQLTLVGGGPLLEELQTLASRFSWLNLKTWVGYADLPALYAKAEVFVLPSLFEPWGLVVNEALAAGLPIALSQAVGALPDLLGEESPLQFDPKNVSEIASVLEKLIRTKQPSTQRLQGFSPETWASRLIQLGRRL